MRIRSVVLAASTLLAACATLPPPVTVDEALKMSKAGQTPDAIIQAMRDSRSTYRLTASDIIRLHGQGMPMPVLDYMQQTQIDSTREDQQMRDYETSPPRFGWHRWW
ncbi:MAG: hypothetical protein JO218_03430 [Burkholderiales bacterium]|nr:hypothetical protein [Burkholderiales bacterium]